MSIADPALLSLLEKSANPLTSLQLKIHLKGIFAPPEQWKLTDQANPNIFTYQLECFSNLFKAGKIEPRKFTEKQLKQQQDVKNKKAGKKQSKEEEVLVVDPEAEKKKIEWDALPENVKFYKTSEDPYKGFSLKFIENEKVSTLQTPQIEIFQSHIQNGFLVLELIRKPQISEDEVNKLKKSKPKTLNIGELYSAKYTGKLNLQSFREPGIARIEQRVQIIFTGDVPADGVKIQSEKCYVLVEVDINKPLTPLVSEITPQVFEILPQFRNQYSAETKNLVAKLQSDIKKGIRAISQEYTLFFAKEKDHQEDKRFASSVNTTFNNISTLRINEINKRKELFLNQFINSGKFNILRLKISAAIKNIVVDKFRKEKTAGTIDSKSVQNTLSELNVYFKGFVEKTINQCVSEENNLLHEDLILGHENTRALRKQVVAPVLTETKQQKEQRIATQYEIANKIQKAEEKYLNLILLNKSNGASLESYAKFCLKHQKFNTAYTLYQKLCSQSNQLKFHLIIAIFLMQRKRIQESIEKLKAIENFQQVTIEDKIVINELISFNYEQLGDLHKSEKYLALVQKYYQIKVNPHLKMNPPINPYLDPSPKVPKPAKYISQLSNQESQEIRIKIMSILVESNFGELAEKYLRKIVSVEKQQQFVISIEGYKGNFSKALETVDQLIEKDGASRKNLDLLLIKADICFVCDKMFECEEVFLQVLALKPTPPQAYHANLRLGLTYLNRKSWEDARHVFNRACELRNNSSIGWLGLGISNLRLKKLSEAEESFNLSNIYNPLETDVKQYLEEISEWHRKESQAHYKHLRNSEDSAF